MALDALLETAFSALRTHWLGLMRVTSLFVLVETLFSLAADHLVSKQGEMMATARFQFVDLVNHLAYPTTSQLPSAQSMGIEPTLWLGILTLTLCGAVSGLIGSVAAVTWLTSRMAGHQTTMQAALGLAARRAPLVIVMAVLYALGAGMALLALIIPGIILFNRWSLAVPVMMMERTGPMRARTRSSEIIGQHGGAVMGFWAVAFLMLGVLTFMIGAIGLLHPALAVLTGFVILLGSSLWVTACLSALYLTLTGRLQAGA
ncbi:MAG: hypothetical protein Alpg2KO_25970 [Alphaproteobacteria bacterium]